MAVTLPEWAPLLTSFHVMHSLHVTALVLGTVGAAITAIGLVAALSKTGGKLARIVRWIVSHAQRASWWVKVEVFRRHAPELIAMGSVE